MASAESRDNRQGPWGPGWVGMFSPEAQGRSQGIPEPQRRPSSLKCHQTWKAVLEKKDTAVSYSPPLNLRLKRLAMEHLDRCIALSKIFQNE